METVYGTMKDLEDYVYVLNDGDGPKWCMRSQSVLLRSLKTNLPLGAFAPDGGSGGSFYSRRNILNSFSPSHQYGDSMSAYNILLASVQKKAEKKLKKTKETKS